MKTLDLLTDQCAIIATASASELVENYGLRARPDCEARRLSVWFFEWSGKPLPDAVELCTGVVLRSVGSVVVPSHDDNPPGLDDDAWWTHGKPPSALPALPETIAALAYARTHAPATVDPLVDTEWEAGLPRKRDGSVIVTHATLCTVARNTIRPYWDERFLRIFVEGKELAPGLIGRTRETWELKHQVKASEAQATQALQTVAYQRSRHDVREYLSSLDNWDRIDRVPRLLESMNVDDTPLHRAYISKWLVSCVARVLSPGCKCDTALVLVGDQGYRKTSCFQTLAGADWFSDTRIDLESKDGPMQLFAAWIYEWGEIEGITSKKSSEIVKSFMSQTHDAFRLPYGSGVQRFARHSVIVGSTNSDSFLNDPTGDRRFWVLKVRSKIDLETVRKLRTLLWTQAVHQFRSGVSWHLSEDEDAERDASNARYRVDDALGDKLAAWWESKPSAERRNDWLLHEVAWSALQCEPSDLTPGMQRRLGTELRKLGWVRQENATLNIRTGTKTRTWQPPQGNDT